MRLGQSKVSVAIVQQHGDLLVQPRSADQHIQSVVAVYIPCHDLQPTGGRSYPKDLHGAGRQL